MYAYKYIDTSAAALLLDNRRVPGLFVMFKKRYIYIYIYNMYAYKYIDTSAAALLRDNRRVLGLFFYKKRYIYIYMYNMYIYVYVDTSAVALLFDNRRVLRTRSLFYKKKRDICIICIYIYI